MGRGRNITSTAKEGNRGVGREICTGWSSSSSSPSHSDSGSDRNLNTACFRLVCHFSRHSTSPITNTANGSRLQDALHGDEVSSKMKARQSIATGQLRHEKTTMRNADRTSVYHGVLGGKKSRSFGQTFSGNEEEDGGQ